MDVLLNRIILMLFVIVFLIHNNVFAVTKLCDIGFENAVTDSLSGCTVDSSTGISYVAGKVGSYAGETTHNTDDGFANDMTISLLSFPDSNAVYTSRWVKYTSSYWGNNAVDGCAATWNVKQLWVDIDGNNTTDIEMAISGYNLETSKATWYIQHGGVLSPQGNDYIAFDYIFGDWMLIEIYTKFVTGDSASSVWVKINGTKIYEEAFTSTTAGASTYRSPGIKGTCDCDTGEGTWDIDGVGFWDGIPTFTFTGAIGKGIVFTK